MSIKDFPKKIKPYWEMKVTPLISKVKDCFEIKEDTFIILVIILIGLAGFGLGKLSSLEKGREPVTIKPANFNAITVDATSSDLVNAVKITDGAKGLLVASKTGTKYYFPWCSGVSRISEKNKIWFDSYDQAKAAGLTAATNCPNLK